MITGAAEATLPSGAQDATATNAFETGAAGVNAASASTLRIYMPDGQLRSWDLTVYVSADIPSGVVPTLRLLTGHAVTQKQAGEDDPIPAKQVSRHQQWPQTVAADQGATPSEGTLLLFDGSHFPVPAWKPMIRVRPVLEWTPDPSNAPVVVVGSRAVNIGNAPTAWAETLSLLLGIVLIVLLMAKRGVTHGCLLCADDGRLSLSKFQMALWTLAVGAVVFFFGIVRLEVPDIPPSLVVLMGLSVAATGASYRADAARWTGRRKPVTPCWRWSDLIATTSAGDEDRVVSLSRAQMFFWTVLMLVLFLAKSILSGVLWPVPWELIALMGISQVGYLAPKFGGTSSKTAGS